MFLIDMSSMSFKASSMTFRLPFDSWALVNIDIMRVIRVGQIFLSTSLRVVKLKRSMRTLIENKI